MPKLSRLAFAGGLSAALALTSALPAPAAPSAASGRATTAVDGAVAWLVDQQQADGGFELAGFPGFETPDAILALAAAGQSGVGWSEAEALSAVTAVETGGKTALDGLDDWVDSVQSDPQASTTAKAQQAAKVIALVTEPLGLDATDLDPSGDTAEPVDLTAALAAGAGGDGSFSELPFGGRSYALWAVAALGQPVDADLLAGIRAARDAAGGWNYLGDPSGTELDVDATAIALLALSAAGVAPSDPDVRGATLALARAQRWTGQWAGGFDDGNPNSTGVTMLALAAQGSNPAETCWRERLDVRYAGVPYPSPVRAIERDQLPDGRIASPTDGFGVNTFPTTQAIQGLMAAEGVWPYPAEEGCTSVVPGTSRRLVNAHYVDHLSRFSDEPGAAFWVGQLDAGASPAQVSRRLTGTSEYGRRVVGRIHRHYLGRAATDAEMTASGPAILAGRRLDVTAQIIGGAEYLEAAGGTADDWVEAAWLDALGRPIDDAGRTWALGQLEAGRTRTQVARSLVGSTEGLGVIVNGFYQDLLRRTTDAAGRDHWIGEIRRGRSPEGLVLLIAGSAEYVARTAPAA